MKHTIYSPIVTSKMVLALLGGAIVTFASPLYAQLAVQRPDQTDTISIVNVPIPLKYVSPAIAQFRTSTRVPFPPSEALARQRYIEAQMLRSKGISLFVTGRTQSALDVLNKARILWPDSAEVYHWLAEAYMANGQSDKAIDNYRLLFYGWPGRTLRDKPSVVSQDKPNDKPSDYDQLQPEEVDPRLWLQFSLLLQKMGQHEEAVATYNYGRQYLAAHPMISPGPLPPSSEVADSSSAELESAAYTGLAIAERAKLANDDALSDLDHALNLQPSLAVAHFYRGEVLKEKPGRTREALTEFSKAAQCGGSDIQPFLAASFQNSAPEFKALLKTEGLTGR